MKFNSLLKIILLLIAGNIAASVPTVYQWRIYCITERMNVYEWNTVEPTTCPNNTAHVINLNSISIVDQINSNEVKVQAESVPTGGYFRTETFSISSTGSGTTTAQMSWPFNISLLMASCTTTSENVGDIVSVAVPYNLSIGTINQNVAEGDTTLNVSSTVIDNIAIGFYVSLFDGTNTDDLGRVIAVSATNNTITVETASTHSYLASTPTQVSISVYPIYNFEFGPPQTYNIGQSSLSASSIPANIPIVVSYTNNGTIPKTLVFNYEYLY